MTQQDELSLPVSPALRAQAEAIAVALGEPPELVLRLALRVGLAALPERLALFPETMERAHKAISRRRRADQEQQAPEPLSFAAALGADPTPSPKAWADEDLAQWSLAAEPSLEALVEMIQGLDDQAGHHILWVDYQGGVHATCLPPGEAPALWIRAHESQILLMETYSVGNGYVGPEAAKDLGWMQQLYDKLNKQWEVIAEALRGE